jgi:5-methylcytosine-specific restriction endonuclease McrA
MRRRKKGEVTKLKDKLWKLVRAEVIERDNSTCQKTGQHVEGSNCHVSHVIPKSAGNALRFDPMNLKVLSYHSHINWWHKNPLEAAEWFKEKFPDRWEYLQEHKNDEVHWKAHDYQEMIERYT